MNRIRSDQRGFALASTFLLLLLMATMGTAAMVYTSFDLRSTNHYNTGNQAMYTAEAGIVNALNTMNMTGVTNFNSDVVQRWSALHGTGAKTLSGYSQFKYTATVVADATSPASKGSMTITGQAPYSAQRVIKVGLKRGDVGRGKGAIYLAADSVGIQFTGNAFEIDGNDHQTSGALTPGGPVEPGIATRNDAVTNTVKNALNNQQKDNVKGAEFTLSPLNPSVVGTGGPDVYDLDRIIANVLATPGVVTESSSNINSSATYGSLASPQITRMTADNVKLNGNASGAGILVVEGSITINGSFDFVGWILVRGDTVINDGYDGGETTALGNATIYGSLWTGDMIVKVGGSALVNYCEACMSLITPPSGGGYTPKAMTMTSWQEVL